MGEMWLGAGRRSFGGTKEAQRVYARQQFPCRTCLRRPKLLPQTGRRRSREVLLHGILSSRTS